MNNKILFRRCIGIMDALGVLNNMREEKKITQQILEKNENAGNAEWLEMALLEREVIAINEAIERIKKVYVVIKEEEEMS